MANWFETKVRYDKVMENGAQKKVTDTFLVDAINFTEAESRITEEVCHMASEFSISAVKRTKIAEIFFDDVDDTADKWYLVKVGFITIDEKSAVEKKSYSLILVQAGSFKDAFDKFTEGMKGTMADYEIASLTETPILDVYKMKVTIGGDKAE